MQETWDRFIGREDPLEKEMATYFSRSLAEGEGGMIWEDSTETGILSYVTQIASPGSMYETGAQDWYIGMTQRDGMGREMGRGFRLGNTCVPRADSC